jgi:hypothetical protein
MKYFFLLTLFFCFSLSLKANAYSYLAASDSCYTDEQYLEIYPEIKASTAQKREDFLRRYKAAKGNSSKQNAVITEAQTFLNENINSYFEFWYNTPWDFNGTTRLPKKGNIACGYFVTTILQDMGFKIPRIKWAQSASEIMIKNMTANIKRFYDKPIEDVAEDIKLRGEGVYIVGLDFHVGFIYSRKNEMHFIHSNYHDAETGVMKQQLIDNNSLKNSYYRVTGKIFTPEMTKKWILGEYLEK